jgi:hypothetical protein
VYIKKEKMKLVTKDQMEEFAKKYSRSIEGANIPTDIIDVDKLAKVMQDQRRANNEAMIIEVSPIIKKTKRDTNLGITNVKDPYNNVIYGIYAGLDSIKNIVWARIGLDNGITLNLDNINDAKRWVVIRMHPRIKGSPFENEPLFEVNDPTIEAGRTYQKVEKTEKLFAMLRKMNGVDIIDAMRYLGEPVNEQTTFKVAKARIYDLILSNSEYVYQKMTSKQKGMEAKILAAVEYGIVQEMPQEGFIYNEVPLGISMNDVINYFETNKTVRDSILSEIGQKDVISHNAQSEFENLDTKKDDNIF